MEDWLLHCRNLVSASIRETPTRHQHQFYWSLLLGKRGLLQIKYEYFLPSPQLWVLASIRRHCTRAGAGVRITITNSWCTAIWRLAPYIQGCRYCSHTRATIDAILTDMHVYHHNHNNSLAHHHGWHPGVLKSPWEVRQGHTSESRVLGPRLPPPQDPSAPLPPPRRWQRDRRIPLGSSRWSAPRALALRRITAPGHHQALLGPLQGVLSPWCRSRPRTRWRRRRGRCRTSRSRRGPPPWCCRGRSRPRSPSAWVSPGRRWSRTGWPLFTNVETHLVLPSRETSTRYRTSILLRVCKLGKRGLLQIEYEMFPTKSAAPGGCQYQTTLS